MAASKASFKARTPSAGPPGWAMIPPPAAKIRFGRTERFERPGRLPRRLAGRKYRHDQARLGVEHRGQTGAGGFNDALVGLAELIREAVDMHVVDADEPPDLLPSDVRPPESRVPRKIAPPIPVRMNRQSRVTHQERSCRRPRPNSGSPSRTCRRESRRDHGDAASRRFRRSG